MSPSIPKTQLAAVSDKPGHVEIREVPVVQPDELQPGRALVKLLYSGVCHTDLHLIDDECVSAAFPGVITGHEGVGHIVAINDPQSLLQVGDTVGIKWIANSCGHCDYCLENIDQLCPKGLISSLSDIGTYQQYCPAYTSHLVPLPETKDLAAIAPVLCAGVTVYRAIKTSRVRPGQSIAIFGAGGGLGTLAVQYARYMGLAPIAIDTGAEKQALVEKLGAERWIDFKQTSDMLGAMKQATPDGLGPYAAIVAAPNGEAYSRALEYVRPGGVVVAVGLPGGSHTVPADVFTTVLYMKTLAGSAVGSRLDAREAVRIAVAGHVKSPYRLEPFKKLPEVLAQMKAGTIVGRVVLDLQA